MLPLLAVLLTAAAPCSDVDATGCAAACDAGDAKACLTLGNALVDGKAGLSGDGEGAVTAWDKGCTAGSGEACNAAAMVMFGKVGRGTKADTERAQAWSLKGCALQFPQSCANAGAAMIEHKQAVEGVTLTLKACELKLAVACETLASFFDEGLNGVANDPAQARTLREKACTFGGANACLTLGLAYDQGAGVTADKKKAHALYEKGCALDSGEACLYVSIDKRTGEGTPADKKGALAPLEKACTLEVAPACHDLSVALFTGDGVKKDVKRAFTLARAACSRLEPQVADACVNAGLMLRDGQGTKKDAGLALGQFDLACGMKSERGCTLAAEQRRKTKP